MGGVSGAAKRPSDIRLDALAVLWLAGFSSANTRDAYGRDLEVFKQWCQRERGTALTADSATVEQYRRACVEAGAAASTVARRLAAISSFYAYAVEAEALSNNPVDEVRRPDPSQESTSRSLSTDEAGVLYDAAVATSSKTAVLVTLLLLDGMKLGEALGLDVDALEQSGRTLRATVNRRGAWKSVPLDRRTARAIASHLTDRIDGPLLTGDRAGTIPGRRLTRYGADYLLKQAALEAGLGAVSANTLRRTYIVLAHEAGTPLGDIQRHVGHGTARGTGRYVPA